MRIFLLALIWLPLALPAQAWAPEGHEIIARIAADNLTPSAHLRISQLLGGDAPALMVLNADWADEIRADRPQTVTWHFVNIEIGSKGYNPRRNCPHDDCVVAQIDRDVAVLKDGRAPHTARLEALLYLIHFVGDVHQPLHAADRRDKGGNSLAVYLNRHRDNLHGIWDQDVVAALGKDPLPVAAGIEAQYSLAQKTAMMRGTPADWANESFEIAAHDIYAHLRSRGPVRLPRDYAQRQSAIVRLQLERAGLRLAMLLNQIFR
jgi:nuclease S1